MVTACAQQGDILWLEKEEQYVLVLSREFFNQSGMSVVCPLRDNAKPDALHIGIFSDAYHGTALLEQEPGPAGQTLSENLQYLV